MLKENENLRIRLQEAEDTLQAIREGAVDAIVVKGRKGEQVFTLTGEEQIYRTLVETMGEAGITTTPQGKILFCNRQFSEMLSLPMEQIVGQDIEKFIKNSDRKKMAALLIKAQVEPSKKRLVFLAPNGTPVPAWVSANLLEFGDSPSICFVAMDQTELEASKEAMRQIAEQREELKVQQKELRVQNDELIQSQTALSKLNRILHALSSSNQAMMHSTDEKQYLKDVCKIIVNDCGYAMVWIGFAQDNKEKSVTPVAYSGFDKGYLETLKITWADTERGRCPTGTAIRTGKVSLCRNMLTDPRFKTWRAEAKKRGYASSIALPLMEGSKAFGALTIYSKESDPFSTDEVILLTELASDLAYGIAAIRSRAARQKAEDALGAAHRQTQSIIDNATAIIYAFDLEERFLMANITIAKLLNSTPEQMIGKRRHEFMPKTDADWHEANDRKVIEAGRAIEFEEHSQLQGRSITWLTTKFPLRDAQGRIYAVAGISADVSERKQAEEALLEVHNRLKTVFESITDAFFSIDKNWCFTYVNAEAAKLLQKTADQLLGKNIWEMFPPAAGSAFQYKYELAIKENKAVHFEEYYPPFNTWFEVHAYPSALGLSVYFRDITAKKQYDEKLKALTTELQRSNTELQQFANVISHDLKEPLRAIDGFMELLRQRYKEKLDEKGVSFIQYAIDGVKRMDGFLKGLLDYSRVQTHDKPIVLISAAISLDIAIANLKTAISETNTQITSDELPTVKAYGAQLSQLFQNLIHNAIKFKTADGPPKIHVGCQRQQNEWLFSVKDNGIGFDPQFSERIFMMFQRLHPQDKYPGYGVGLAICKRIVERLNGKIWVESQPAQRRNLLLHNPRLIDSIILFISPRPLRPLRP